VNLPPPTIINGDCVEEMARMAPNSIDAIITDPPYGINLFGAKLGWDKNLPSIQWLTQAMRILKPGAHLISFGAVRTIHKLITQMEQVGFEVRDVMMWMYWSGWPKGHCVSQGIDRHLGAVRECVGERKTGSARDGEGWKSGDHFVPITAPATDEARKWKGWNTALKPSFEPAAIVRKPMSEKSIAANVLRWGVGAINVDGCRAPYGDPQYCGPTHDIRHEVRHNQSGGPNGGRGWIKGITTYQSPQGRWPSNHYYCPKPSVREKGEFNTHVSVKPLKLMAHLCRLITPPGGLILDPFVGSGSTLVAAQSEGFRSIGIERESEYIPLIERRLKECHVIGSSPPITPPHQKQLSLF